MKMRYWKALDETAKIIKPTFLVYKTNKNCEGRNCEDKMNELLM